MVIFGSINVAMFDWPWSGIHFTSGLIVGLVLMMIAWTIPSRRFWLTGVGVLILWELTEVTLRFLDIHAHDAVAPLKNIIQGFAFAPESAANIIGDLIIGSVGLAIGRTLKKVRRSVI